MIGQEMLDFRARYKVSQEKCAKACGISIQTWCSVEREQQRPSFLTEAKIRALLDSMGGAEDGKPESEGAADASS